MKSHNLEHKSPKRKRGVPQGAAGRRQATCRGVKKLLGLR